MNSMFYNILEEICKNKRIDINQLFNYLNIDKNDILNLKNGALPNISQLISIADYLRCSLDELVGRNLFSANSKNISVQVSGQSDDAVLIDNSFDTYTDEEQKKIVFWITILNEWSDYCSNCKSKTQAVKDYAAWASKEYDRHITIDILYRKRRHFKKQGLSGLIDHRGGHNKGSSIISEKVWSIFMFYYQNQPYLTVTECYKKTEKHIKTMCPNLLPLPSYNTFVRRLKRNVK